MNLTPGSTRQWTVIIRNASTFVPTNPDSGADPTITIWSDGTAITPTVTWTNLETGVWAYSYAVPSSTGVTITEVVSATVSGAVYTASPVGYTVTNSGAAIGNATITATVESSASGNATISGATVTAVINGLPAATSTTNSSGIATLVVAAASGGTAVDLSATAPGYFGVTQSATVSPGNNAETIQLSPAVPTASVPPDFCSMNGTAYVDGAAASGVTFTISLSSLPTTVTTGTSVNKVTTGTSGIGGAIGPVFLLQGATYNLTVGNGPPQSFVVPSATTGLLPFAYG